MDAERDVLPDAALSISWECTKCLWQVKDDEDLDLFAPACLRSRAIPRR
jgi:hypothetical protein